MQLRHSEKVLKIFRRHPTPFAFQLVKIIFASFPFFLLAFFFANGMTSMQNFIFNLIIIGFFSIIIMHTALIYWLDRVIVTNQRIIYVNWVTLFRRDENEAELNDIQEIYTKEKGVFSAFYVFDYGTFRLETAGTKTTIFFQNAPDPEGMKQYIYSIKNPYFANKISSTRVHANSVPGAGLGHAHNSGPQIGPIADNIPSHPTPSAPVNTPPANPNPVNTNNHPQ